MEGDISDIDDPELQDDVKEEILREAFSSRVLDEGVDAGETLNIDRFSIPAEIHARNEDNDREGVENEDDDDDDDMLVQLYRTNIKGRRFYLRIIFHLINMACVNAWLLYRRYCNQKNKKYQPLLDFLCDIAAGILKRGKNESRKKGRPTLDSPKPETKKKRKQKAPHPVADVPYDSVGHWPEYLPDKSRCKFCIKSYSRMKCGKCNVALCLNKERNCFKEFHII